LQRDAADRFGQVLVLTAEKPALAMPLPEAEEKAIKDGTVSFVREKGIVSMTLPLHDRNGEFIAAVRVRLKSFFGETQDNALTRGRIVVKQIQDRVMSDKDLL
jgi:hypothetical protein